MYLFWCLPTPANEKTCPRGSAHRILGGSASSSDPNFNHSRPSAANGQLISHDDSSVAECLWLPNEKTTRCVTPQVLGERMRVADRRYRKAKFRYFALLLTTHHRYKTSAEARPFSTASFIKRLAMASAGSSGTSARRIPATMSRFSFSDNTAPLRGTFDSALRGPSSVDSQARDEKVPAG